MKVLPFKIPKSQHATILFQNDRNKLPYGQLHQHEEYQITLVESGNGNMITGDTFNNFRSGDIFVFGSHLPHVFTSERKCSMVSLFFTERSLGSTFFELPQLEEFRALLESSNKGLKIESSRIRIAELIHACEHNSGVHSIISFLQLLQAISKSKYQSLSVFSYTKQYSYNEGKRMMNVFDYAMNNFEKEIKLEDVSSIAMLSTNAFCKYFKQRTNKTFFEFLIEVRIEKACELILNGKDLSVEEIAHNTGFNNLSNFNRKFKSHKHMTPTVFKKKLQVNPKV